MFAKVIVVALLAVAASSAKPLVPPAYKAASAVSMASPYVVPHAAPFAAAYTAPYAAAYTGLYAAAYPYAPMPPMLPYTALSPKA